MNLETGKRMHKGRCWEIPITESVIRAVEALAESQGYAQLKLTNKNKTWLLPGDWEENIKYIYNDEDDKDFDKNDNDNDKNEDNNDQLEDFEEINKDAVSYTHLTLPTIYSV